MNYESFTNRIIYSFKKKNSIWCRGNIYYAFLSYNYILYESSIKIKLELSSNNIML